MSDPSSAIGTPFTRTPALALALTLTLTLTLTLSQPDPTNHAYPYPSPSPSPLPASAAGKADPNPTPNRQGRHQGGARPCLCVPPLLAQELLVDGLLVGGALARELARVQLPARDRGLLVPTGSVGTTSSAVQLHNWSWYRTRAHATAALWTRGGDPWTKKQGGGVGTAQWG